MWNAFEDIEVYVFSYNVDYDVIVVKTLFLVLYAF